MPAPTISEYLKFANLQMAAEALYRFKATNGPVTPATPFSGEIPIDVLTDGNLHASRFTVIQANVFAAQWEVVEHISNTSTGFSGTLFRNKANPNELVLSFRSTEFIDDSARDNKATNELEIAKYGWAFGQISDMEVWYADLRQRGLIPDGAHYSVTGYSLGGHLATAFNLLRQEDGTRSLVDRVVTFNGAGVGEIAQGTLGSVLANFNNLRSHPEQIEAAIDDAGLRDTYRAIRDNLANGTWDIARAKAELNSFAMPTPEDPRYALLDAEKLRIWTALDRIEKISPSHRKPHHFPPARPIPQFPPIRPPSPSAKSSRRSLITRWPCCLPAKDTRAMGLWTGLSRRSTAANSAVPAWTTSSI